LKHSFVSAGSRDEQVEQGHRVGQDLVPKALAGDADAARGAQETFAADAAYKTRKSKGGNAKVRIFI